MEVSHRVVGECYPPRPEWSKKHDFGYVAVVGGSKIYPGAPVLVGLSALRAGADLVYLVTPRKPFWAAITHPELVALDLGTEFLTQMSEDAWIVLGRSDSLVIGNGLTRRFEVGNTVGEILGEYNKPVVVDADALHFLGELNIKSEKVLLTPHISEFKVLTGEAPETLEGRKEAALRLSDETGYTVLLKGHVDVIAGGGKVATNSTGNAFMTKGGTGDLLAGVCGALLARGVDPFKAACCAAYINGRAGELASKEFGEGTLPTDIARRIPEAIRG